MGVIEEARGDSGSGVGYGSRFGSREPSAERDRNGDGDGGWASYAFPTRSQFQGSGPTPLGQDSGQTLNVGMSEAALDGVTPVATRLSFSRSESGGTVGRNGREVEKEDTASESGTTVVATGEGH